MGGRTPLSSVDYLDSIAKKDVTSSCVKIPESLAQRVSDLLSRGM